MTASLEGWTDSYQQLPLCRFGACHPWSFTSILRVPQGVPILLPPGFGQSTALLYFNAVNQSFFMGVFFWISGRMSAQSLNKAGVTTTAFLRTKLIRLGIPTLINTALGPPLIICLAQGQLSSIFPENRSHLRGVHGVAWYTATLLALDMLAAVLHLALPTAKASKEVKNQLGSRPVYDVAKRYGWMLVVAASFLIRLEYPVGRPFVPLAVQPAYLAQYIFSYALGHSSLDSGDTRMESLLRKFLPVSSSHRPLQAIQL